MVDRTYQGWPVWKVALTLCEEILSMDLPDNKMAEMLENNAVYLLTSIARGASKGKSYSASAYASAKGNIGVVDACLLMLRKLDMITEADYSKLDELAGDAYLQLSKLISSVNKTQ